MNVAIQLVGWTLLHFVWQGTLIAAVAAMVLRALLASSAQARYVVGCAALILMTAAPLLTASVMSVAIASQSVHPKERRIVRVEVRQSLPGPASADVMGAVPPPAPHVDRLMAAAVAAWLTGVALLALRLGGGWWRASRLQRRARALEVSRWSEVGRVVAAGLGITRVVHIIDADLLDTPTVIGWLSPVVVLPLAALANLSPAQIEGIIAHELAHVRRHDYLVNLLQTSVETLLFYHPAVWWLSGRIRSEREHCCDDLAVWVTGDRVAYASALAELEEFRSTSAAPRLVLAATGGSLLLRVRRLLGHAPAHIEPATGNAPGGVLLLVLVLCGTTMPIVATSFGALRPEPSPQLTRIAVRLHEHPTNDVTSASPLPPLVLQRTPPSLGASNEDVAFLVGADRISVTNATLRDLIRFAYGVQPRHVRGGPAWIASERFSIDIVGDMNHRERLPARTQEPGAVLEAGSPALQAELANRFGLAVHVDSSPEQVYVLTMPSAGKPGASLHTSATDCSAFDDVPFDGPRGHPEFLLGRAGMAPSGCGLTWADNGLIRGRGVPVHMLAETLSRSRMVSHDVVDWSGLTGPFDFDLMVSSPAGLLAAVRDQLGLEMVETTMPADIIVVDRAHRPERQQP